MIDLKLVQKDPQILADALKNRHSSINIEEFRELDQKRRSILAEVEALKSERNQASAKIAAMKKEGRQEEAQGLFADLGGLSDRIHDLDIKATEARTAVENWLVAVPNIPDVSVPVGQDESKNVEIDRWGAIPEFSFEPRDHADLGAALGGLDFERAARLAGSRFVVEFAWAARLDRALASFFLDRHRKERSEEHTSELQSP